MEDLPTAEPTTATPGAAVIGGNRHGWSYSITAGLVTGLAVLGLTAGKIGLRGFALYAIVVFVCARIGGWLALVSGGRDHGWRAGLYASALFCPLMGLFFAIPDRAAYPPLHGGVQPTLGWFAEQIAAYSMSVALFGSGLIVPIYLIGTLFFQITVDYLDKRRAQSR